MKWRELCGNLLDFPRDEREQAGTGERWAGTGRELAGTRVSWTGIGRELVGTDGNWMGVAGTCANWLGAGGSWAVAGGNLRKLDRSQGELAGTG